MTKITRRGILSGLVLLTTGAAAGSLLAACSGSAPAGSGPVTIDFWDQFPELKAGMQAVAKQFQGKYPNITVNVNESAQYQNQLQTALNAGIGPDTFDAPSRPRLDVMAPTGQLLELNSRVDQSAWTDVAKEAVTVKGKVWSVPTGKYTVGIAYHIELFDKAGITSEPTTWADFGNALAKLQETKVIPYSIAASDGSLTYFNYIGLASTVLGLDGFNAVNDGKRKLTDPDLVAVIQQMIDWDKFYEPNFVGTPYRESKALFATGKAAAMDAGSADFAGFIEINPTAKFGFMYWPAPDAQHKPCTNTGISITVGVNAKGKHQDQSVTFANWLGTPEGGQSMNENMKVLPVVNGVKLNDPLQQKMIDTPLDVPVWSGLVGTENIGQVWTQKGQAPFEGKMTAAQLAKLLQDNVDAQLATAAKQ